MSQKNINGLRIHVFTKYVLRAILLNIQDPAAPSEICSACYSLKFQDPAARNKIFRNIRTTTRDAHKLTPTSRHAACIGRIDLASRRIEALCSQDQA